MAYGHGERGSVKRLLALGVGELSAAKRGALAELRFARAHNGAVVREDLSVLAA